MTYEKYQMIETLKKEVQDLKHNIERRLRWIKDDEALIESKERIIKCLFEEKVVE